MTTAPETFHFPCPGCPNFLRVPVAAAGKQARCAACGAVARVPARPPAGDPDDDPPPRRKPAPPPTDEDDPPPPRRRGRKAHRGEVPARTALWVGGALALVFVGACVAVGWYFFAGRSQIRIATEDGRPVAHYRPPAFTDDRGPRKGYKVVVVVTPADAPELTADDINTRTLLRTRFTEDPVGEIGKTESDVAARRVIGGMFGAGVYQSENVVERGGKPIALVLTFRTHAPSHAETYTARSFPFDLGRLRDGMLGRRVTARAAVASFTESDTGNDTMHRFLTPVSATTFDVPGG